MGDSNLTSNLVGDGTVTITGISSITTATQVVTTQSVTTGNVTTANITTGNVTTLNPTTIKFGTKVIVGGVLVTEASIVAVATHVGGATGSLYLGPSLWVLDGTTTATKLSIS